MANPYRGEAPLRVGGEVVQLELKWRTMGALVARFGPEWDVELNRAFGVYDMEIVAEALSIATGREPEFFLDASPPVIPVRDAWTAAYNLFLFGVPTMEEVQAQQEEGEATDRPLARPTSWKDAAGRLLKQVWRRPSSGPARSTSASSSSGHAARA